jgi:hypothetical protein
MIMTEREKGQKKFRAVLEKTIQKAQASLNVKVQKTMNLTASNGVTYETEAEIMDAYAYEDITDGERYRLLQALEFQENRPLLQDDYLILLCRKALALIDDDNYKEAKKRRAREIENEIAEIKRTGGNPILCGCCGCVIGETDQGGYKTYYPIFIECGCGRICEDCQRNCRNQCKEK